MSRHLRISMQSSQSRTTHPVGEACISSHQRIDINSTPTRHSRPGKRASNVTENVLPRDVVAAAVDRLHGKVERLDAEVTRSRTKAELRVGAVRELGSNNVYY